MRWTTPSRSVVAILFALIWMQTVCWSQVNSAAAAASSISRQVSAQEWLGPLSAVALSPFFGLACLSGIATYGPEWLQSRSALFGQSSPLNSPLMFWVMLGLTVATSLPRFTKVSKPFALAVEKLEMYSAVIILVSIKFIGGWGVGGDGGLSPDQGLSQVESVVMSAGIATLPIDTMLSIAAALNIVVVNTIKLAIEFLVWLIPFPTVDAFLEVGNKTLSASLMALYAYSPFLATLFNLCILGVCCFVFFRVKRRLAYMKELIVKPLLGSLMGWTGDNTKFIGFLSRPWNGFPSKTAFHISQVGGKDQVQLQYRGWTKRQTFRGILQPTRYHSGLVCDQMTLQMDSQEMELDVRKGLMQPEMTAGLV
jgi:hypothetical protein